MDIQHLNLRKGKKGQQALGISILLILLGSILSAFLGVGLQTLGIFDGTTIGPTQNTIELSPEEHLVGSITGGVFLNADEFAVDWRPSIGGSQSESISVDKASIKMDFTIGDTGTFVIRGISLQEYWYEWEVDGVLLKRTDSFTGLLNREVKGDGEIFTNDLGLPPDLNIKNAKPGLVNCKLVANVSALWWDTIFFNKEEKVFPELVLAEYGAELVSGAGHVKIGRDLPDTVQTGTDLVFELVTGYSAGRGWDVKIHPPAHTGISPFSYSGSGFNGQDFFGPQKVSFTIPEEYFKKGADNEGKVTINNGLFTGELATFFSVDDINQIPTGGGPTGVIESVTGLGTPGSEMTINLLAVPNEISNSEISYFRVYVYYGVQGSMPGPDFPELYILNGKDIDANQGQGSQKFLIPINSPEAQISIKANAIDADGRASQGDFFSIFINDPDKTGGDEPDYAFSLGVIGTILVVIAILIFIVAGIALITGSSSLSWKQLLALASVFSGALLVVAALFGYGVI